MLEVVKKALRVSHNALDDEIDDLIEAARTDLKLSGVSGFKSNDDTDPLIKRAIIMYAKLILLLMLRKQSDFNYRITCLKSSHFSR